MRRTLVVFTVVLSALLAVLFSWRRIPYAEVLAQRSAAALVSILESRFDRAPIEDWSKVKGLVVPGGDFYRRYDEALRLAVAHPHLRIVVSGVGLADTWYVFAQSSADVRGRIAFELRSSIIHRNTYGNAVFSKELIRPASGERWLLVTTASHMPRAIGAFRKAGFPVEPWPVPGATEDGDCLIATARHEWLGLIAYRLLGRTDALVPG